MTSLFCNGKPSTISVHKSRRTNLHVARSNSSIKTSIRVSTRALATGAPSPDTRYRFTRCSAKMLGHRCSERLPLTCEPGPGTTAPNIGVGPAPSGSSKLLPIYASLQMHAGCTRSPSRNQRSALALLAQARPPTSSGSGLAYALALPLAILGRHHK